VFCPISETVKPADRNILVARVVDGVIWDVSLAHWAAVLEDDASLRTRLVRERPTWHSVRTAGPEELDALAAAAGMKREKTGYWGFLPPRVERQFEPTHWAEVPRILT
jgi:hypothetical protein